MVDTKPLLKAVVLLMIAAGAALWAMPGNASAQDQSPRNLWDHWSSFSIPINEIAGMAWDGRTLWVLDRASKEICCLAAQGRIAKRLPLGGNVVYQGLAFDGKAFWTWNRRKKCFLSITANGNRKEIAWSQTRGNGLECVGGKLVFIPTDDKKIAYLDVGTGEAPGYMAAPCRDISALAWDGRYLWCLNPDDELVGYDARRQLAFTAIPLEEPAAYVAFGGGRFWTASEKAPPGGMLRIHTFPMPRHGDICLGEPEELIQVMAAGVANPHPSRPATDVSVLIGSIPLDDVHQKIVDARFNLPHSGFYTDGDRTCCVVIPNVTVPPTEMVSIHGVIRYTSRSCRYVILPDDMPPSESVPADLRDKYTRQLEDMAPVSVVEAAKEPAGGETHPYWKMRRIHDWIISHVDYGGEEGDPESVIQSGKARCGGYSGLTRALFRLNAIPCRVVGAYGSGSHHVWNQIWLPGLSGWVDVDCMADDRDNRLSYVTSRSIGRRAFQLSTGVSKGAWLAVNGRQLEICEERFAGPQASGKAVAPEAAIVRFSANTTIDAEPVCYGAPFHWRMRSGAMEIVWPQAYDFQDGTNLKYEIYASTQPMYERDRDGKGPNLGILLDKTSVPYWRIQGLEPAEQYFVRVVAVDSTGNKSKDPSVSGNIRYRHIYRDRLLRRQGVWGSARAGEARNWLAESLSKSDRLNSLPADFFRKYNLYDPQSPLVRAIPPGIGRTGDSPVEWPTAQGGNGHIYLPVSLPMKITWKEADLAAKLVGGYLATLTSARENAFVFDLVKADKYWDGASGPWLGGYQMPGSDEPDGGWRWVTGEPFDYANWQRGQPNDHGDGEDFLHFRHDPPRAPLWNDIAGDFKEGLCAIIIEFSKSDGRRVEWPRSDDGNGHIYQPIALPMRITWQDANVAARRAGGHLATITSPEENAFVFNLVNRDDYWDEGLGPWLGGYQVPGSDEPHGGWRWVTDEPFYYCNWSQDQPSNGMGGESFLHFGYRTPRAPEWNDIQGDYRNGLHGFVIEFSKSGAPRSN